MVCGVLALGLLNFPTTGLIEEAVDGAQLEKEGCDVRNEALYGFRVSTQLFRVCTMYTCPHFIYTLELRVGVCALLNKVYALCTYCTMFIDLSCENAHTSTRLSVRTVHIRNTCIDSSYT